MPRWLGESPLEPFRGEGFEPDPARACGECGACCHAEQVYAPPSRRGEDCEHLLPVAPGQPGRCGIHEARHFTCESFQCRWVEGWGDDAWRPDRSGLVFWSGNDQAVRATEAWLGAADEPLGQAAIAAWLSAGTRVGLYRHGSDALHAEWFEPKG